MVILNSKYVNNIMVTINKELCLYGVFLGFSNLFSVSAWRFENKWVACHKLRQAKSFAFNKSNDYNKVW